ncbi:MAG: TonB-dependent receptor [Acidobacteria bacterium]|nr:TonB-dependent receptor [Acidobacteriota bacterium]
MRRSVAVVMWAMVLVAMVMVASPPVFGQSGSNTTTLSGLVVDAQGGVIPGADVVGKNNATGATVRGVTDAAGRFVLPQVPPGTYTVTVALMGFKTAVAPDVQVVSATPASVKMTLQVGGLEETVVVTGATEIVQTQSATVSTTVAIKQIQQLPVISHTALDFLVSLPGVETTALNFRGSTINGLPTSAIDITLDGINVQDKRGTEGMFMYIRPMMDSVEEVTISTSNANAGATGAGGATIKMETRSGSNRFTASAYNTWRNQAGTGDADTLTRAKHPGWLWGLNTPYWFNIRDIPKTAAGDYYISDVRVQTPGFRLGGPIFKDKLFYFFNYEVFLLPQSIPRTRYVLNTSAQAGLFTYPAVDGRGNVTVNLYTIAAANAQTTTPDPALAKLLTDIRTAITGTGGITAYDQNVDKFDYAPSSTQLRKFPTVRMDYNITNAHRISFTYRYNKFDSTPDFLNSAEPRYPGFPNTGGQVSGRYMWQTSLRSTLGKSMVNELRVGAQDATGLGTVFGDGVNSGQFNCSGIGCQASGGVGYSFGFPSTTSSAFPVSLSSATAYGSLSAGVANQRSIEDNFTWLRGKHSLSFGGSYGVTAMRNYGETPFQTSLTFGTGSTDTVAYAMLDPTTTNFPGGINSTYATYARTLYGFLTGRVNGIASTYYLQPDGTYIANGVRTNATTAKDLGLFASDAWRLKPNLTLTLGVRYQVQLPMTTDGLYSRPQTWQMVYGATGAGTGLYGSGNLYKPGTLTGTAPVVVPYENNRPAYNTDWNNVAPSVGFTYRPNLKSSFLSTILSNDPVFRGGYAITYTRLGTGFFDSNYSGNPGRSRAGARSSTAGTPLLGFDGWPVLLRDGAKMYPSAAPAPLTGNWSLTPAINESIDIHYPNWPVPSTHQYSFGIQRELGKSMALDVRYVGNINVGGWTTWNMNGSAQWSMLKGENGFYDEFRLAQANLRANILAGNGNTFAYTGAAGTSPLPIFQAYFAGTPLTSAANQVPANYTSANYKASSWYNSLSMYNPSLTGISGTGTSGLQNSITTGTGLDANRIAAGLPVNFFMANPALALGNSYLETTAGNTRYNSIQVELRRRMSSGFLITGNYTYQFSRQTWTQRSLREDWFYIPSGGGADHTLKANWVYELPFGRGKAFGSGASRLVDGFIGGWEIDGVARIQSGPKFNFGGYRLVGMTDKQLQDMFKFYHVIDAAGLERIYMLPQDVIANSILALYTQSATTATGYSGTLPTGAYLAPASGPDCVQYLAGQCPGTATTRLITGPKFWKVDLTFVKRISMWKNLRLEARMDLFNVFNTINFTPTGPSSVTSTTGMGSSVTSWQVVSAANDSSNSQDPGGRITQFGLRITW